MQQLIKTYHAYTDEKVNKEIEQMISAGWMVKQFEYSSQIMHDKVRSCLIILYERG